MKTYRFYSGPNGFRILLELADRSKNEWMIIRSTSTDDTPGRIMRDIAHPIEWCQPPNYFAMEFEAHTMKEVEEKIFVYML